MLQGPFLGMDPFLEEPSAWAGVHSRLINTISDELADLVGPAFFVAIEERVYIVTPDELMGFPPVAPDVFLVEGRRQNLSPSAGVAITPPLLIEPLVEEEIRDRYLEIRDTSSREVITTIAVLSPFNKAPGTRGREAFLRKRQAVMESYTHWMELDLLRAGERPPEVRKRSDYYALLRRGQPDAPFAVWLWGLRERLPTIAVPLRPPFPDAPLDLQSVFTTVYRRGHYGEMVDYDAPIPAPPLPPADARWAAEQIEAWRAAQSSDA